MKRIIILLIALTLFFTACGSENNPSNLPSGQISGITSETNSSHNIPDVQQGLSIISNDGFATQNGFYYLESKPLDGIGLCSLIMYLDVPSMLQIPLCNKPDCKHVDVSCNAVVKSGLINAVLFTTQKMLYLIEPDSGPDDIPGGLGGRMNLPQALYSMNMDGTSRTKLLEFASGVNIRGPYVINGNKLYCVQNKIKSEYVNNDEKNIIINNGGLYESSELICIDLEKKTTEVICDFEGKFVIGVYKNSLIIETTYIDEEYKKLDPDKAGQYYNSLDRAVTALDLSTKEEKTYIKVKVPQIDNTVQEGGTVCFLDGKKVKKLNLETGEITDVSAVPVKPRIYLSRIVNGRLMYSYSDNADVRTELEHHYYYDFASGENKVRTLYEESPDKAVVEIVSEFGGSYIVITKREDTPRYALIKKSDYLASKASCTYFEED